MCALNTNRVNGIFNCNNFWYSQGEYCDTHAHEMWKWGTTKKRTESNMKKKNSYIHEKAKTSIFSSSNIDFICPWIVYLFSSYALFPFLNSSHSTLTYWIILHVFDTIQIRRKKNNIEKKEKYRLNLNALKYTKTETGNQWVNK